jgi:hypothetical protein
MESYYKMRMFIELGVSLLVIIILISWVIFIIIKSWFDKKFKRNCFNCIHYNLYNVASVGDGCRYKCDKFNRIDGSHSMNVKYKYVRCNGFESK